MVENAIASVTHVESRTHSCFQLSATRLPLVTPHIVGVNGRSPLHMACQRSFCVSPKAFSRAGKMPTPQEKFLVVGWALGLS